MGKVVCEIKKIMIPTYPEPEKEELPLFSEHRVHQRSTGRPYPNKVTLEVNRQIRVEQEYTVVHMENDYLDIEILPQIGGRIFSARDKKTDYDFFYRQHVIKPGLIGALGSWISGGVEFNWPYHHRASGFMACDFEIEETEDGSCICWLSEHDPIDRMKGMVGIVLRPDASYLETRVKLCNRTPVTKSFLWWENAAVPVNENYQIFFPKDVTYVNFHYLDSRISYPIAGDGVFNGIDMTEPRDISMHKNTKDATSYFACASKYDFFGGYDHGLECGVVHIGDHHISPGKKMFTWAYNQLSKTWENTLTDTDGQYCELMAGSYTDNQPNFSWLEPYETKEFSQYWYPVSKIGTPDFANLECALSLKKDCVWLQSTVALENASIRICTDNITVLEEKVQLSAGQSICLPWEKPAGLVSVTLTTADGTLVAEYIEELPDNLKKPPVKDPMPTATEVRSADELYLAGVHVEQYRDPAVMPDAYWLEALKRDPYHAPSLLGMAKYSYQMARFEEAQEYAQRAIHVLSKFNERLQNGDPWYQLALIQEEQGNIDEAYDNYYRASWNGSAVAKSMARIACIDLKRCQYHKAVEHARVAISKDINHPLATAVLVIALELLGKATEARSVCKQGLASDRFNMLLRWLSEMDRSYFFEKMDSDASQTVLDIVFDLDGMGQYERILHLLDSLLVYRPDMRTKIILYTKAYYMDMLGIDSADLIEEGDTAPLGSTYPVRFGEIRVLQFAKKKGSKYADSLLGCLLYDKRQYDTAAVYFREAIQRDPNDYMNYRNLAVAYFSHLNRKEEALTLMDKAIQLHYSQQMLYETVILMDLLGMAPKDKIAMLKPYANTFTRDDLFVELAKAYNQNGQPEMTLKLLMSHVFVACEGGEHAIADQYMYAYFQLGMKQFKNESWEAALDLLQKALTLPSSLGSGIWNRCKYVPYRFYIAKCMEQLGRQEEANSIYRDILNIQVEFFSNMHLRELPFYQAKAAEALGMQQRAWNIMAKAKREWCSALTQKDNGYFSTTPFFISFVQDPAILRKSYYTYLLALVKLYEGKEAEATAMFRDSYSSNTDNLFCHFYAFGL